jgi:hypothetical protein
MDRSNFGGRLSGRSPAVDFIDERFPCHDPTFLNAPSAFDNASGRYLPIMPNHLGGDFTPQPVTANQGVMPTSSPSQVAVSDQSFQSVNLQSMRFWNDIFAQAMTILSTGTEEPKVLTKSNGGIRNAGGWEEVCFRLNEARNTYTGEEGTAGTFKRMRRKVADNFSQPAAHITKMVPDIDPWTTPVAGTVGILLQAVTIAAKTRQDILTRLGDIDKTFSNINSFAATFPKDYEVRQASVSLVVAIFQAVEQAMAFFVKSPGEFAWCQIGLDC